LHLAEYLIVPKPQHAKSRSGESSVSVDIVGATFRVLTSIDLHNKLRRYTHEVQHITSKCVLPPKFEAIELAAAQCSPQLAFRVRHIATQLLRQAAISYGFVGLAKHRDPIPAQPSP
jgi:hypothetical protein